jgi:hypothetical protein
MEITRQLKSVFNPEWNAMVDYVYNRAWGGCDYSYDLSIADDADVLRWFNDIVADSYGALDC